MVLEEDRQNVTFRCSVTDGNPDELLAVRWFLNGDQLREVPGDNCTNITDLGDNITGESGMRIQPVSGSWGGGVV